MNRPKTLKEAIAAAHRAIEQMREDERNGIVERIEIVRDPAFPTVATVKFVKYQIKNLSNGS